ncbi:MAG: winged helix-turn-helix transcriptional regulator [Sphingopyxis sp.]|nr:winged helix-turn-helix transcriptional regulator [Sphingopyxis sp.]
MIDQQLSARTGDTAFAWHGGDPANPWPTARIGGERGDGEASPWLLVGPAEALPDTTSLAEVRLANMLPPARAERYIRHSPFLDIVWLSAAETLDPACLEAIFQAVTAQHCQLICETSLAALDRMAATIPASIPVQFLVDADPTDKSMALAAARRTRHHIVHDVARDDAMERIDRLQDEVARIGRLLADLAGQRGGLAGTPAGRDAEGNADDVAGRLRARSPDFAVLPRSFVPEERTLDRQRAKMVRRMLRQRRMREQYFPADLFADPAWDMLLDLYAARLERQPVSVSSLCIAAAVPATTALRWIKTMTDAGLFVRDADPHDGRRIFIALAEAAHDAMARYFEALDE